MSDLELLKELFTVARNARVALANCKSAHYIEVRGSDATFEADDMADIMSKVWNRLSKATKDAAEN